MPTCPFWACIFLGTLSELSVAFGDLDSPTLPMIECSVAQSKTFHCVVVFSGVKPARSHRGRS